LAVLRLMTNSNLVGSVYAAFLGTTLW
jgi:hypothetical protein